MATYYSPTTPPTPFLAFQGPPHDNLRGYNPRVRPVDQPSSAVIPRTFLDAMIVREEVYVREQGVPLANEFDVDDFRSCHWVIYRSECRTLSPERRDPATNEIVKPRRSQSYSVPIGTIRLVPFPHAPHPTEGESYVDGRPVPSYGPDPKNLNRAEPEKPMGQAPYGYRDRETSLHDGRECYVKLGRLAVVRDARGRHYGRMLVDAALAWMCKHPGYFNPSVANWGLEALGYTIPEWRGLVCVHAQVQVVPMWESMGFKVDEKMGKWYEEGIPHVGMWKRCVIPEVERRGS